MKNKYSESIFLDRWTSWEESTHGAQSSIGDWLGRNLLDSFPAQFQPIFGEISFDKAVGAPLSPPLLDQLRLYQLAQTSSRLLMQELLH